MSLVDKLEAATIPRGDSKVIKFSIVPNAPVLRKRSDIQKRKVKKRARISVKTFLPTRIAKRRRRKNQAKKMKMQKNPKMTMMTKMNTMMMRKQKNRSRENRSRVYVPS